MIHYLDDQLAGLPIHGTKMVTGIALRFSLIMFRWTVASWNIRNFSICNEIQRSAECPNGICHS